MSQWNHRINWKYLKIWPSCKKSSFKIRSMKLEHAMLIFLVDLTKYFTLKIRNSFRIAFECETKWIKDAWFGFPIQMQPVLRSWQKDTVSRNQTVAPLERKKCLGLGPLRGLFSSVCEASDSSTSSSKTTTFPRSQGHAVPTPDRSIRYTKPFNGSKETKPMPQFLFIIKYSYTCFLGGFLFHLIVISSCYIPWYFSGVKTKRKYHLSFSTFNRNQLNMA